MQIQRIALAAAATAAIVAPTASAMPAIDPVSPSQAQAAADAYKPAHLVAIEPGHPERTQSLAPVATQVRVKDTGIETTTALAGGLVLFAAILLTGRAVLHHRNRTWDRRSVA